jgi:hypothetical protein
MKTFTIENETNNITLHTMIQDAEGVPNAEWFRNEAGLSKLAAEWPAARLVEIWNTLPGVTPVEKFKDRTTAVSRIWKAIQILANSGKGSGYRESRGEFRCGRSGDGFDCRSGGQRNGAPRSSHFGSHGTRPC